MIWRLLREPETDEVQVENKGRVRGDEREEQ